MSFDSLLRHQLEVHRVVPTTDPPTLDELGQPLTEELVVATVRGLIQPSSENEMELLGQNGAVVSTHTGFVRPFPELLPDAWIVSGGVRYDIVGMPDAGGQSHHLELRLKAVS